MAIHRIPISRPDSDRSVAIFWGQLEHHRQRRRRRLQLRFGRGRRRTEEHAADHVAANNSHSMFQVDAIFDGSPMSGAHETATLITRATATSDNTDNNAAVMIGSMGLSSCHSILYTGEIALGTPPQTFTVDFDTASTDVYVPSSACDESCATHPYWRKYRAADSSTYAPGRNNNDDTSADGSSGGSNMYLQFLNDGESLIGEFVRDVLHLGDDVSVKDQVFAQIDDFSKLLFCQGQEGVLGLGFQPLTNDGFPSVTANLISALRNPVFSLFLDKTENYPENPGKPERDPTLGPDHEYDGVKQEDYRPFSASSEIVFGGVNAKRYTGCLTWHDVVDMSSDNLYFWSFTLDHIRVGDTDLGNGEIAIIDSASTFVEGPLQAVADFCEVNKVECFDLDFEGDAVNVDCGDPQGFDAAAISCDADLIPLQLVANGITYELGAAELYTEIDTKEGDLCFLRLIGSLELPGWIIGDAFLDRYYSVFDFDQKRVGFAERSVYGESSVCEADWPLDLTYDGGPAPAPVPTASHSPTPKPISPALMPTTADPPSTKTKSKGPKIGGQSSAILSTEQNGAKNASMAIVVAFTLAAIAMVTMLSRRRQRYHRAEMIADRYDDGDYSMRDVQEVELPGLL